MKKSLILIVLLLIFGEITRINAQTVSIPLNEIHYTASERISYNLTKSDEIYDEYDLFGAFVVSHTFFNGKGKIVFEKPITRIGLRAFEDVTSLLSITIPNSVLEIERWAFFCCKNLSRVTIGNSVFSIKANAFYGCTSLKSITIPHSVTLIESEAFYGCENLASVTIGDGVVSIGTAAFENCSSLMSVTIGKCVTTISYAAFAGCSKLIDIYCKSPMPPKVYYDDRYLYKEFADFNGSFPLNSMMNIYVPHTSLDLYRRPSAVKNEKCDVDNWTVYKRYVKPYEY